MTRAVVEGGSRGMVRALPPIGMEPDAAPGANGRFPQSGSRVHV